MDRIDAIEERQGKQGEQIAVLQSEMRATREALNANTIAITAHTRQLSEYNGARKMVHWLATAGAALAAYLFGKNGGHP